MVQQKFFLQISLCSFLHLFLRICLLCGLCVNLDLSSRREVAGGAYSMNTFL